MKYQTPELSLIGSAQSLVLGQCPISNSVTHNFLDTSGSTLSRGDQSW